MCAVPESPDVEETVVALLPLAGIAPQAGSDEASGTTAARLIRATIATKTATRTGRSDLSIEKKTIGDAHRLRGNRLPVSGRLYSSPAASTRSSWA